MAMATASAFSSLRFSLRTQHRQHKHKHVVRVSKANTHCQSCSCTLARCCRRRHCLLDRTHTHTQAHTTDTHAHRDARTHSHGGDATIVPLKKVGTNPRLINCQQCECDGYTTHNSAPANCVLRARHCRCMRVQAMLVYCVCVYCGELLWKSAGALSRCTKWGPGPSEWAKDDDWFVSTPFLSYTHLSQSAEARLLCAALLWRCRCRCRWLSAPFFCCFCLVFVFRLFLRNVVVVVVVVFARFVRLKFIWLWPKGDGL